MIFGGIVPVADMADTVEEANKQTLNDNGTNIRITA